MENVERIVSTYQTKPSDVSRPPEREGICRFSREKSTSRVTCQDCRWRI